MERFLHSYALYLDGMATEAKHRETKEILSVEDYVIHRRENCSVRFYLIFIEIALRIDFPPELLEDPNFVRVNDLAIDLVAIINVSQFPTPFLMIFSALIYFRTFTLFRRSMLVVSKEIPLWPLS